VLNSPGKPLEQATRTRFESRFGRDFSHVRVHTDAQSMASARAINALAYTMGPHIVLVPTIAEARVVIRRRYEDHFRCDANHSDS